MLENDARQLFVCGSKQSSIARSSANYGIQCSATM